MKNSRNNSPGRRSQSPIPVPQSRSQSRSVDRSNSRSPMPVPGSRSPRSPRGDYTRQGSFQTAHQSGPHTAYHTPQESTPTQTQPASNQTSHGTLPPVRYVSILYSLMPSVMTIIGLFVQAASSTSCAARYPARPGDKPGA